MRELDTGRGTSVPGLWEVELSSASDVDAVISHVQRISQEADHSKGTSHSVIQLAISSEKTKYTGIPKSIRNTNESGGMGKISFLLLGGMEEQQRYPWVDALRERLQWLESRAGGMSGSPESPIHFPYQKSKLTLMLRDVLRGKQEASLLIMIAPKDHTSLGSCHQWLQLGQGVAMACSSGVGVTGSSLKSSSRRNQSIERSRSPSPSRQQAPINGSASFRSNTPSAGNYDYAHYNNKPAPASVQRGAVHNTSPRSLLPPNSRSPKKTQYAKYSSSSITGGASNDFTFVEGTATTLETASLRTSKAAEIAALTEALELKNEQLLQSQLAYDVLIKQLHEDGSTLKAKDKQRYNQVQSELKDYEIYRDVMETALARMQQEVESLTTENNDLRDKMDQMRAASRKRNEFKDQYSSNLTTTRRQLAEAQEKIEQADMAYKRQHKEKEELRRIEVALKNDRNRLAKDCEAKATAALELKKRIAALEYREANMQRELKQTRTGTDQLEQSLLSYQEENELLKAALTEMLEQAAQAPPPPPLDEEDHVLAQKQKKQQEKAVSSSLSSRSTATALFSSTDTLGEAEPESKDGSESGSPSSRASPVPTRVSGKHSSPSSGSSSPPPSSSSKKKEEFQLPAGTEAQLLRQERTHMEHGQPAPFSKGRSRKQRLMSFSAMGQIPE